MLVGSCGYGCGKDATNMRGWQLQIESVLESLNDMSDWSLSACERSSRATLILFGVVGGFIAMYAYMNYGPQWLLNPRTMILNPTLYPTMP